MLGRLGLLFGVNVRVHTLQAGCSANEHLLAYLLRKRKYSLHLLPEIIIRDTKVKSRKLECLTVDLKVVEDAHPPESQATESNWECQSVVAGYSKHMQRTGHGERETDVRGMGTFTRYVDQVGREACSEQSA